MRKFKFHHQGQSLIGIIIVLVVVSLISGGLYYYLSKQIPEVPEITEKPAEEEVVKPKEVAPPPEEELPEEEVAPEEVPPEEVTPQEEVAAPPCQDECSSAGLKRCFNNGYQTCGNYDEDNCLEWSSVTACPVSAICQNGICIQQKCNDGTSYGKCSTNKPKYCEGGNLVDKCSTCGCLEGMMCRDDNTCIKIERGEIINVGLIIFKYSDTVLPDVVYCLWPTKSRSLAFEECYDVNYGGKGEILSKYPVLDLITDSINKKRVFQYDVIHSLYYLPDYFRNEASKYGLDLKVNLYFQGVFDLTESLPQTYKRPTGGLVLTDYSFFVNQAEKRINLSSFDKLMIVFLNDQDFQDREEAFEFSSAYHQKSAILNFRIRGNLFNNNYLITLSHEFQHVLGARDLYLEPCPRGPYWSCCMDPEGIPEPNKIPKYPQTKACSMCQSIQLNAEGLGQSASLENIVTCQRTAKEMGWLK